MGKFMEKLTKEQLKQLLEDISELLVACDGVFGAQTPSMEKLIKAKIAFRKLYYEIGKD
jgi:ethanolamine utilization protein EutA (predicted chaperonin)